MEKQEQRVVMVDHAGLDSIQDIKLVATHTRQRYKAAHESKP